MYMIYVIYFISKLKEEDKESLYLRKIVVYGFSGCSLIGSISA